MNQNSKIQVKYLIPDPPRYTHYGFCVLRSAKNNRTAARKAFCLDVGLEPEARRQKKYLVLKADSRARLTSYFMPHLETTTALYCTALRRKYVPGVLPVGAL